MTETHSGRQYWFVRVTRITRHAGGERTGITVEPDSYIRFDDNSASIRGDTILTRGYDCNPLAWRHALEDLYADGFVEVSEAKAAGLLPSDWEMPKEFKERHLYTTPEEHFRRAWEHNQLCRRIARDGLVCPRCGNREAIRFADRIPAMTAARERGYLFFDTSYFICSACARSFRPEDIPAVPGVDTRAVPGRSDPPAPDGKTTGPR
jgi:hypothetical protein